MSEIEILEKLYKKEINLKISSFFDEGWTVEIGDKINGFTMFEVVETLKEVFDLLREVVEDF